MNPGTVLNRRYQLARRLGVGGNGTVWEAEDLATGERVAVKTLTTPQPAAVARFAAEARALTSLNHPGCVRVIEVGEENGAPFIAMELVRGETLAHYRHAGLPLPVIMDVAIQVADALAHAHDHGVAHRDLKPDNIMLSGRTGGGFRVTVVDFGLAKLEASGPALTKTGEFMGTPGYMSPEQIRGERTTGPASDQYSFGIVLYELLSGSHPYRGTTVLAVAMAQLTQPLAPLNADVCPPRLSAVIARLTQPAPEQRFPSFHAVKQALVGGPEARVDAAPQRANNGYVLWIAAATLLGVAALAYILQDQSHPISPPPTQVTNRAAALTKPAQPDPEPPVIVHLDQGYLDSGAECDAPAEEVFEFEFKGRTRSVWVSRPPNATVPAPAVVAVTYRRRTAEAFITRLEFQKSMPDGGYVLVGPDPIDLDFVKPAGNEALGLEAPPHLHPWRLEEDPDFVLAAVAAVTERHCLDPNRIHAIGHAEGADVLRKIACNETVPFASMTLTGTNDAPDQCAWRAQLPVHRVVGKRDDSVPTKGGVGCWGTAYISADETVSSYRRGLGCSQPAVVDGECETYTCAAGVFRSCVNDGGHYLKNTNYDDRRLHAAMLALEKPGVTDPFDPKECGKGHRLGGEHRDYGRFILGVDRISPKTP